MKNIIIAFALTLGPVSWAGVQPAAADPLTSMKSACLAGDFSACSRYNAAIISRSNNAHRPVLTEGYDPFRIVPATASKAEPTRPAGTPDNNAVGKSDLTSVNVVTVE